MTDIPHNTRRPKSKRRKAVPARKPAPSKQVRLRTAEDIANEHAVIIVVDAFHDNQDSLDEAALAANELCRAGTQVFLIQQGDDAATARKLQYLQRVSSAAYFKFDPKTQQQQFAEMLKMVSMYAAGGEEAVKTAGGQAANLLLEHLKQQPMPWVQPRRTRITTTNEGK